ncbi:MAG: helix-turn-helix domain-containing protein [Syntrophobacteraceae bacterium]
MGTLVDIKTMAKILSVKTSWIYSNIQRQTGDKQIPHIRVGKHLRFDPEAVIAALETLTAEIGRPPKTPASPEGTAQS